MDLTAELLQLPVDERLKCMEALWNSLRSADTESPEWHGRVLAQRAAKIQRGEGEFISSQELKDRLRRQP